jgi:hypothetical protein
VTGTETRVRPHQPRDSRWGARRVNLAIAATAWMLALAALVLHLVLAPLLPPRIHIRWSDVTTSTERIRVEEELGLLSGAHEQGRTWSYVLRDVSTTSIARLVRHPLVEDTHYIDRSTATLSVDASGRAAWVGDVAQMPFVQVSLRWLPTIAFALAIVGLVGSWPVWHGVVPRAWRQVQDGLRWARGAVRARVGRIRSERRSRDQRVRRMALGRGAAFQLSLILLVSILLRIWLVTSGGQFYWGDESRYEIARDIARTLAHGDVLYAFSRMGQHPLFGVIGAIPATVERLTHEDPRIPGLFFAAFSAMNIGLIAAVAKRSGATDGTSVTAGALIGLSASMLYYARHLLPYDVAMTFGLAALYIGLGDAGRVRSLACGVVAAFAFLTYTGYWTLGGAAMVVHVLDAGNAKTALRRALFGGLGLVATIGVAVVGSLVVGENLIRGMAAAVGVLVARRALHRAGVGRRCDVGARELAITKRAATRSRWSDWVRIRVRRTRRDVRGHPHVRRLRPIGAPDGPVPVPDIRGGTCRLPACTVSEHARLARRCGRALVDRASRLQLCDAAAAGLPRGVSARGAARWSNRCGRRSRDPQRQASVSRARDDRASAEVHGSDA